jgi:outer membrane receptor protein involved in Fe transport
MSSTAWSAAFGVLVVAWTSAALAQDVTTPQAKSLTTLGEVVITGSRIPRPDRTGVSPLAQIDSGEIRSQGVMGIEDVLNRMPQVFVDQNDTVTNGATGTATVNLRDLGAERTLVLIDGKRLMPGDPTSGSVAADLNFIPAALVDRIDIVTGGLSAIYGSDAIAGVVNFIMKRNFTGVKMDAQAGFFSHDNGQTGIQAVLAAQGQPQAPKSVTDGLAYEATIIAGVDAPDGRGNVTVYGGYRATQAITEAARDFSACALTASGANLFCQGSTASPAPGRFLVIDQTDFNLAGDLTLDPTGAGNTLRPFDPVRDAYNYGPHQYFERPDQRYTAGAFAHYQILPSAEFYADAMFMRDDTTAQLAPSGLFLQPFTIACANPMLSAAEVKGFCADANVPPGGDTLIFIGRRDVEAGSRQYLLLHTDWRVVAGVRGEAGAWRYDVSGQYSAVDISQTDQNDVSLTRVADALDVVRGPSGALVCASGAAGCAPYDIFKTGALTQAALAYVETPGVATGRTDEIVVSANLSGALDGYGLKSPWARDGVGVALGAEYRREGLGYSPNAELASGDLSGAGVSTPALNGRFGVYELYGETRLPVAQDRGAPLGDLTIDGGIRYSWYSSVGGAATYKAGVEWAPSPDLRLRAGFSRAVRAPNIVELFTPQSFNGGGLGHDPCAGANPVVDQQDPYATEANCARTGVTAAQYGHVAISPTAYNALEGGNPELGPETADTATVGLVATPRMVPGLSLAVDYFDIRVNHVITALDADVTIEQCLQTGNPFLCGQVRRAPGTGSLWIGTAGYVNDVVQNAASLDTRGVDLDMSYQHAVPGWRGRSLGTAVVRLVGTYYLDRSTVTVPGAPAFDCAGYYGQACGDPAPHWRHTLRMTWDTPWNFELTAAWRFIGPVTVSAASPDPTLNMPFATADSRLGACGYIDLSLSWRVNRRVEVRVGVNNLFDVDPPVVGTDFQAGIAANANTYPGLYDALGRWMFIGMTARL